MIFFAALLVPGPPSAAEASVSGSRWARVSWSPPSLLNGVILYYLVYYRRVGPCLARDDSVVTPVNVTDTPVNLTMLTPFARYRVEVTAVNIRAHDGKMLEGHRSVPILVNTKEDGENACLYGCVS